jgi:hypothetical protein
MGSSRPLILVLVIVLAVAGYAVLTHSRTPAGQGQTAGDQP